MLAAMKLLVAFALLAAACGSKAPTPTTPAEGAAVVLPDVAFDKLDHDQRIAFMKQKVMPVLKPLFVAHDPKDFADFGCATCHGEQAKEGHFDMPNAKLPKLNFKDMSKWKKEDLDWMHNEIEPAMAKVLGLPMYSEQNPKGFGCLGCHTMETPAP
jgi:cytochrome c553